MASGIVAVLDSVSQAKVQSLWADFQQHLGGVDLSRNHYPHFSLHVAESYHKATLQESLSSYASKTPPFSIKAAGLGLFTGQIPVLHINLVRDSALTALHEDVFQLSERHAVESFPHYRPENWLPHITLTQGDFTPTDLPKLLAGLLEQDFYWQIRVEALALLHEEQTAPELTFPLR